MQILLFTTATAIPGNQRANIAWVCISGHYVHVMYIDRVIMKATYFIHTPDIITCHIFQLASFDSTLLGLQSQKLVTTHDCQVQVILELHVVKTVAVHKHEGFN